MIRDQMGLPKDAVVMIFIGRLAKDKGIYELITAYKNLYLSHRNFWLMLVGPGEGVDLEKLVLSDAKDHIRRVPYTSEPEFYLAAADFLCLPSHREGFGVVIIEAAAMGLPAIASNIYGISDAVIDQTTGLLFKCGNLDELQGCIQKLITNKEYRNYLGQQARENAEENFCHKEVVGNYVDYIHSLLCKN
jgi:glycosyltransferase involved in cell wall biosynthesis